MGTAALSEIEVIDAPSVNTESELPGEAAITNFGSFPNPFDQITTLEFSLATSAYSTITILTIEGKRIRSFPATRLPAGVNRVEWDGRTDSGRTAPPRMYVAVVEAPGSRRTHKLARIN